MQLSVYVLGRAVATLAQVGDFKSVLTYHPHVATDDFVSLTMPVRTESYVWDDPLPPVLQMNLPEGYLLQVLQEQFGPHLGARATTLKLPLPRWCASTPPAVCRAWCPSFWMPKASQLTQHRWRCIKKPASSPAATSSKAQVANCPLRP